MELISCYIHGTISYELGLVKCPYHDTTTRALAWKIGWWTAAEGKMEALARALLH